MKKIVEKLEAGTSNEKSSPSDLCKALCDFQTDVSPVLCIGVKEDLLSGLFRKIWEILFKCSASQSSTVRMTTYSTTSMFLLKLGPFAPLLLRSTFGDATMAHAVEHSSSVLVIAVFSFLSHFVAPVQLETFLEKTQIFHQFVCQESITSEHLPNIVNNLGNLSIEWFQGLLLALLGANKAQESRMVIKAIGSVVKRNPEVLMNCLLEQECPLSLASYILQSVPIDQTKVDLSQFAFSAFDALRQPAESRSISSVDDAFMVMSRIETQTVKVRHIEGYKFEIELEGYGKVEFEDEKAMQRPGFYSLPLPHQFLIPKEDDSCAVIGAKLNTLGRQIRDKNVVMNVEEEIQIFDKIASYGYDDRTSGVLQSLALCVNSLIANAKSSRLSNILRRVLFVEPKSWFHASDMLAVIREIDPKLIPVVFGRSGFNEILQTVLKFCLNPNEDLSRSSFQVISKLTTEATFREVTQFVADNTDFFDAFSLQKHLLILAGLITANFNYDRSHLRSFTDTILEVFPYHADDIYVLGSIYQFLTYVDISKYSLMKLQDVFTSAAAILSAALVFLEGAKKMTSVPEPVQRKYTDMVKKYLKTKTVEVVTTECYAYRIHFACIYSATTFLLTLPVGLVNANFALAVCMHMFRYFPLECTRFFYSRYKYYEPKPRKGCFDFVTRNLDAVDDPHIYADWCRIALLMGVKREDVLIASARYFLEHTDGVKTGDLVVFAWFLDTMHQPVEPICEMLKKITPEIQIEFARICSAAGDGIKFSPAVQDMVAQISSRFVLAKESYMNNFDKLIESQKLELIDAILDVEKMDFTRVPESAVKYAQERLSGWDLIKFQSKMGQAPKVEPRSFNPLFAHSVSELNLQDRLRYYADIESKDGVTETLRMASISNVKLDFTGMRFSPLTLPSVISYLMKHNQAEISDVVADITPQDFHTPFRDAAIVAFGFHLDKFRDYFTNTDHTTKQDIQCLTMAIQKLLDDSQCESIFDILLFLLKQPAKSDKRVRVLFCAISSAIEKFHGVDPTFAEEIFSFMVLHKDILPEKETWMILFILSKYSDIIRSKVPFIESFPKLLFMERVRVHYRYKAPEGLEELLRTERPSELCCVLQVMNEMAKEGKTYMKNLKACLPAAFEVTRTCHDNFAIMESFGIFIRSILVNPQLAGSRLHRIICEKYFSDILVRIREAAFLSLAVSLPDIMQILDRNSETYKKLGTFCGTIILQKTSFAVFRLYCLSVAGRLNRMTEHHEDQLTKAILKFLEVNKPFDSHHIEKYMHEWTDLMQRWLPPLTRISILCRQFLTGTSRFFPVFVSIAKCAKSIAANNPDDVAIVNLAIQSAAQEESDPNHRDALQKLLDGAPIRDAIELALK